MSCSVLLESFQWMERSRRRGRTPGCRKARWGRCPGGSASCCPLWVRRRWPGTAAPAPAPGGGKWSSAPPARGRRPRKTGPAHPAPERRHTEGTPDHTGRQGWGADTAAPPAPNEDAASCCGRSRTSGSLCSGPPPCSGTPGCAPWGGPRSSGAPGFPPGRRSGPLSRGSAFSHPAAAGPPPPGPARRVLPAPTRKRAG